MSQILYPHAFPEGITFVRTFTGTGQIHVGELPDGQGYSRIDGQPIQSAEELTAVIPQGSRLQAALAWWEHHDDPEPDYAPPEVTWKQGRLVYVETGAELTSHAEIIQAFPDDSPFQAAALEWFAGQQMGRHQAKQRQDLQTGVKSSSLDGTVGPRKPVKPATPSRSHKKSHHKKIVPTEHAPSIAAAMAAHDTRGGATN